MTTASFSCPRCDGALAPVTLDEVGARFEAHGCSSCGGQFFQAGDLERIDDVVVPTFFEIRRIPSSSEQQLPLSCPSCAGVTMIKAEHERDRKVVVDICPSCQGTWLDRGELGAIQTEGLGAFLINTVRWLASLR